jgi:hypothetical protein
MAPNIDMYRSHSHSPAEIDHADNTSLLTALYQQFFGEMRNPPLSVRPLNDRRRLHCRNGLRIGADGS